MAPTPWLFLLYTPTSTNANMEVTRIRFPTTCASTAPYLLAFSVEGKPVYFHKWYGDKSTDTISYIAERTDLNLEDLRQQLQQRTPTPTVEVVTIDEVQFQQPPNIKLQHQRFKRRQIQ